MNERSGRTETTRHPPLVAAAGQPGADFGFKPCPKCGGDRVEFLEKSPGMFEGPTMTIRCPKCGFTHTEGWGFFTIPDAVKSWNKLT